MFRVAAFVAPGATETISAPVPTPPAIIGIITLLLIALVLIYVTKIYGLLGV